MRPAPLANAGRWLLNRRDFLRLGGTGLGGIALTALLTEQGLLAAEKAPIRPNWSPERPSAPRLPHFAPRANNVLVIFCSGALSHIDSWDYKSELIQTPWPGNARERKARDISRRERRSYQATLGISASREIRKNDFG
jgi:hypothetical protein